MKKTLEIRQGAKVGEYSEHGNSTVDILCPFCDEVTTAYIWSLAGSGKKCQGKCKDTILYRSGEAHKR